ncbi:MAG: carboxypeptidase regulatory-like domain-containing protein, partial [Wenzhouxiangellaceae bacterium]
MNRGFQSTLGRYSYWLMVAALVLALPFSATAQVTSSEIRGQVLDQGGNPVVGATVRIIHVPSGTTRSTTTGASGQFFQGGLRVGGPYNIQASAPGHEGMTVEGLNLAPGSQPPLNLQVVSAEAVDTIRVVGQRIVRGADLNLGVGSTFSAEDIQNQPSIERDVIRTLIRDPLAQSSGPNNLSVAGVNPRFNGLAIDGALQQDNFGLGSNTYATDRSPINLDIVESATVVASDYSLTASNFTGGLVNITTKSGTNEVDGGIYWAYRDDDFVGNSLGGGRRFNPAAFDEEEYGFWLSGPIIKDKLFFMVSYDEFDATTPVDFARFDEQNGVDPRIFNELTSIIQQRFGIDAQGRPLSASIPETSERLLVKLDWNINEDHRLSLTYQDNEETGTLGVVSNNFESAFYDTPRDVTAYTVQLFSDWTSNFSTTFRFNLVEFERGQNCRAGPGVGELRIRLRPEQLVGTNLEGLLEDDTGQTTFTAGCDRFRHANTFSDERLQLFLSGDYVVGDHVLTAGVEWEDLET